MSLLNGGIIRAGGAFVDWDPAQHPSLDFVAGNWGKIIGTSANLKMCFIADSPKGEIFEEAILLGSRSDSNWFHFLIETLPRILIIDNLVKDSVPILISNRVPSSGLEALRLVTSRHIIMVDPESTTFIRKAYVPAPSIYHPDTQFLWDSKKLESVDINLLTELRAVILSKINMDGKARRLYIPRSGMARVALNSRKIAKTLSKAGFETVEMGSLPFHEQVQMIGRCEALVTEGGASMSNFIFLPKSSKILVLMSELSSSYVMPSLLGEVAKSDVRILGGRSIGGRFQMPFSARLHTSYRIKIRLLRTIVAELTK